MPKSLMIVCDETVDKYARYLQQLVSASDDEEGKQVGTKDGSVVAAINSEKEYEASKAKYASSNYILFMGDSKTAKDSRANMVEKFNKCGMHYGWLGRQAYMYADPSECKKENMEEFESISSEYGKVFESASNDNAAEKFVLEKAYDESEGPAKIAAGLARLALGRVALIAELTQDLVNEVTGNKDARDRLYTMATLILYMDGLSEFMDA